MTIYLESDEPIDFRKLFWSFSMFFYSYLAATRREVIENIENVNVFTLIFDQLQNISQIQLARHRSVFNFIVFVWCGLIGYCRRPKKHL